LAQDARLWEYTKTILVNETFEEQFEKYMQAAFDERATRRPAQFCDPPGK
jgi:hypothetical protein